MGRNVTVPLAALLALLLAALASIGGLAWSGRQRAVTWHSLQSLTAAHLQAGTRILHLTEVNDTLWKSLERRSSDDSRNKLAKVLAFVGDAVTEAEDGAVANRERLDSFYQNYQNGVPDMLYLRSYNPQNALPATSSGRRRQMRKTGQQLLLVYEALPDAPAYIRIIHLDEPQDYYSEWHAWHFTLEEDCYQISNKAPVAQRMTALPQNTGCEPPPKDFFLQITR